MQRVVSIARADLGICGSIRVVKTKPAVERVHPPDALFRLLNRVMRPLIARGHFQDQLLLLHYVGRRSGRRFDVPAGYHMIDGVPSVLTSSGWRHNFAGGRSPPSGDFVQTAPGGSVKVDHVGRRGLTLR
jgi:hypothetical protein